MVQILPQKTNLGSILGQSLGQGLQGGLNQSLQQQYQRGQLQQALGKVRGLSQQENVKPVDLMLGLMEAGAGIPGSEKYLATLLPTLLSSLKTEQLYGKGETTPGAPSTEGATPIPSRADASKEAEKFVSGEKPAGFLAQPMNPQEMESYAERYAQIMQNPEAYDQGYAQAQRINENRIQSRQSLQAAAVSQGITPEEMPRFIQSATEAQNLNDLAAIERKAIDTTKKIRNKKEALQNIETPGIYQKHGGALQHFIPGMTLYKALTSKGEARQKALKGYSEQVRELVADGEEPFVRETLAKKGLSPTEVEELIHPISDFSAKKIQALPKGNQLKPAAREKSLVNFFKENVNNDSSLLVLRDNLINQKGYSWEEVLDAINKAFPNSQNLNDYQKAEKQALAKPPIQSLNQIFGSTPNVRGFLRGQK